MRKAILHEGEQLNSGQRAFCDTGEVRIVAEESWRFSAGSDRRRGKVNWTFPLGLVLMTGLSVGFWVAVGIVISRALR
jgi:hypothetical protein